MCADAMMQRPEFKKAVKTMPKPKMTDALLFPFDALEGDPTDTDDGRLTGSVIMSGIRFWCEALPVKTNAEGIQEGLDPTSKSRLEGIASEFDSCGFQTVELTRKGITRDYMLIIVPGDQ